MGTTLSITLPDKLEAQLTKAAQNLGISRSRYIGNILLKWSEQTLRTTLCSSYDPTMNYCTLNGELCTFRRNQTQCIDFSTGV